MGEAPPQSYAVRLCPAKAGDLEALDDLAVLLAPVVGWSAEKLAQSLYAGPCEVARDLSRHEANGLVEVLESLGGVAEVVSLNERRKVTTLDLMPLFDVESLDTPVPSTRPLVLSDGGVMPISNALEDPLLPERLPRKVDPMGGAPLPPSPEPDGPITLPRRSQPTVHRPQAPKRSRASIGASLPDPPPRRWPLTVVGVMAGGCLVGGCVWLWAALIQPPKAAVAASTPTEVAEPVVVSGEPAELEAAVAEPAADERAAGEPAGGELTVAEPAAPTEPAAPAEPAPPEAEDRAPLHVEMALDEMFANGKRACERGLYDLCEETMQRVIQADPNHGEAYKLMVQAVQSRDAIR